VPVVNDDERGPCGSGDTYGTCCGPLHRGEAVAPTAERLMRSRYTAFVLHDARYLLATWHPSTRPPRLHLDADVRWLRLLVLGHAAGGPFDEEGTVEFEAIFRTAEGRGVQHENSRFVREDGRWVYVSGLVAD
jgi:SEC-C motif-containing protein